MLCAVLVLGLVDSLMTVCVVCSAGAGAGGESDGHGGGGRLHLQLSGKFMPKLLAPKFQAKMVLLNDSF